jgi:hypothetical protein
MYLHYKHFHNKKDKPQALYSGSKVPKALYVNNKDVFTDTMGVQQTVSFLFCELSYECELYRNTYGEVSF